MKIFYTFIFYTFFIYSVFAQSSKYRNYKFEWPSKSPSSIEVDSLFLHEDAVILEENCIYNEGGLRVPEYYFLNIAANYIFIDESVQGTNPLIKKHMRIKFLTQKGIDKYSKIILPESFDPASDYYSVRPENRKSVLRPLGEFECIKFFAARIIKPDGTIKKAIVKERTNEQTFNGAIIVKKFYNWIFQLENLEIGDEVELDYSYEGVYNFGDSNRIFFNSDIPIQSLDFTFRYPEKQLFFLNYHNGAFPKDSTMVTSSNPHYTEYYFHLENLKGCINEPGARPYMQLPFFTFYEHLRDYGIMNPVTKYIQTPLPYPWSYIMLPLAGYKYENPQLRLGRTDITTVALNKLAEEETKKAGDKTSCSVVSELQSDLAENFLFKDDLGYYLDEDEDIEHLGKNIENKTLRQMSRIRLYDEIMTRLDTLYYHSLLTDKRISEIDINHFETLVASRLSIAVPYNNYILHFYPKSYRFGYESNELPFYYEDTYSVLTPQNEQALKKFDLIPQVEFKFIKTPISNKENNFRNTSCKIDVSFDLSKVNTKAKIHLSGQFSTMTRGFYKYGSVDTTMNPTYYKIISLTADDQTKVISNIAKVGRNFPFETTINQEFTLNKRLKKNGEKDFTLDLKNLFNNIIEEEFNSKNRCLDYYPDFQSQDMHRYFFHFDHPITITNILDFNKKINNFFSNYEVNVSQPTEKDVLIECSYIVKVPFVPSAKAFDVEEVFNAIHSINNSTLKIHKTD